ncbi:MAG TPA: hypothetical protein VFW78_05010 [Bacteroidia bacterium]|nr:hypothetical protein [Bacteroidia bacterium]
MNITRDNYEPFFIDYFDGNLDVSRQEELFSFLEQHPDLKNEFESFNNNPIEVPEEAFEDKHLLQRNILTLDTLDQYLIAELEGDLSNTEQEKLTAFLFEHPELSRHRKLIKLTRLPVSSEIFTAKEKLKQPVIIPLYRTQTFRYAIAAAILLLLLSGGALLINRTLNRPQIQVAQQETPALLQTEKELQQKHALQTAVAQNSTAAGTSTITTSPANPIQKVNRTKRNTITTQQPNSLAQKTEIINTIDPIALSELEPNAVYAIDGPAYPAGVSEPAAPLLASAGNVPSGVSQQYPGLWTAIKEKASDEIEKASGTEAAAQLAAAEGSAKPKVRWLGIISRGVELVFGDKVTLKTSYDVDGDMMAYNFKAGGIKIEKR